MNLLEELKRTNFDEELFEKYLKRNQKEYIRKRLKAVKLFYEGKDRKEIMKELDVSYTFIMLQLEKIKGNDFEGFLKKVVELKTAKRGRKLKEKEEKEMIDMVLNKTPKDYGYESNLFIAKILIEIIKNRYGVEVSDEYVYRMLKRHGLSYQKAHRDYEDADPESQKKYVDVLKKN